MSLRMLLLWHCLNGPHDNRDTETFWAVAPAHPASPKVPLCVSMADVVGQEMPVKKELRIIIQSKESGFEKDGKTKAVNLTLDQRNKNWLDKD